MKRHRRNQVLGMYMEVTCLQNLRTLENQLQYIRANRILAFEESLVLKCRPHAAEWELFRTDSCCKCKLHFGKYFVQCASNVTTKRFVISAGLLQSLHMLACFVSIMYEICLLPLVHLLVEACVEKLRHNFLWFSR